MSDPRRGPSNNFRSLTQKCIQKIFQSWGGPFHSFSSWTQKWKIYTDTFLSSRWKVMKWTPQIRHLMEILEILLFHVWSNSTCKFPITLFPISWGPFQDVNLLYFLLKMQIWNGCNVLNIVGNPIKDISVNLSFLSSRWKVVEWTPPGLENVLNAFLSSGSKVVWWTPLGSDISWKFWKFYFSMYRPMIHANMP